MSRDLRIRSNDYAGRSHIAPGARCEPNVIQLAGRSPTALDARLHGPEARNDHAFIYRASMQTGNNLSPGLFASVVAGSHGGDNDLASFTSRAALKLAQFAQAIADVTALLFIGIFATLYFLSPFIALACFIISRLK